MLAKLPSRRLLAAFPLLLLGGCVHPAYDVGVMARLYRGGRYGEALQRAVAIEHELPTFPPRKVAHYYIYRGASHLGLREYEPARYWIGRAVDYRRQYPMVVTDEHAAVLDHCVATLQQAGYRVDTASARRQTQARPGHSVP